MTEQDRGAYTPQTDAPLAFDARHSHGGRGSRAPVTLIASALILAALVAALFMFYRSGVRGSGQPPQVVGAPVGETKAPPPASAAASASSAGLQVYKSEATPAGEMQPPAPAFVPPPEQAAPRPAPPPPAATPAPQAAAPKAAAPAPVKTPPKLHESEPMANADDIAASGATSSIAPPKKAEAKVPAIKLAEQTAKPKVAPKAKAEAPAEHKPAVAAAPAAGGRAVVQIGAFSSAALADKGYKDVSVAMPGQMGGKSKTVETVAKDGKTFYRTAVAGFSSRTQAETFCASLRAAGHTCFVR